MPSKPPAKERLALIEQSINSNGIEYAEAQLDDFSQEANDIDQTLSDQILNIRLQILIGQGRFDDLERCLEGISVQSTETSIRCLAAKGILANRRQDYQGSLINFLEAESKAKTADLPILLAQIQINIGTVYAGLHHYQQGLDRYAAVLADHGSVINNSTQSALLHNLGNLNYAIGNTSESIRCLEASIAMKNEMLQLRSRLLLMRSQLVQNGSSTMVLGDMVKENDLLAIYLYCQSFYEEGNKRLATLEKVVDLAKTHNDFKTVLDALKEIIEIHKGASNWKLAFAAMQDFRSVEEALLSIQQTAKLAEQAARYELAEKERSIAVLQKEKDLQDEIVKRNEMLEVANEELRQFAYVVSHDLKEPLRMIGAYTQLIEMGLKNDKKEDQKEYFDFVSGGVARLNVLLDGLSNFSTLKSLQEQHETLSLKEIIQTANENLDVLIQETESEIHLNAEIDINGSPALLILLFQNLIQNAIKFRRKNSTAVIQINAHKGLEKTTIEISDNGVGIAKNQRERVFVIFQRLARNHSDGSGMGLAICKKIVQLHEGSIFVKKSSPNDGSTFCIELPN